LTYHNTLRRPWIPRSWLQPQGGKIWEAGANFSIRDRRSWLVAPVKQLHHWRPRHPSRCLDCPTMTLGCACMKWPACTTARIIQTSFQMTRQKFLHCIALHCIERDHLHRAFFNCHY
jgi:hypothetical protein